MILAGVDLAWKSDNPSGVAIGELRNGALSVLEADTAHDLEAVKERLGARQELTGVAIDAPLIIRNTTGQRPCETAISKAYWKQKCGCHTSNLTLYPEACSVALSEHLEQGGFQHLGKSRWQVEVYPHPAIVEIFGLAERLRYKKGKIAIKAKGQAGLARLLRSLSRSPVLPLSIPEDILGYLSEKYIASLDGKALKQNEDLLDALVCLYIAGLYTLNPTGKVFGDVGEGYVYVPQQRCVDP